MYYLIEQGASELSYMYPWLLPCIFGLLGLSIGSYLNVVVYRLPRGLSTREPKRSFCPSCRAAIPWYFNLPLIGWLVLLGRSACCKTRISCRYPLIELSCGLLFAGISWHFSYESLAVQSLLCIWAAASLATFCIDWDQMVVLSSLTVIASLAGLAIAYIAPWFNDADMAALPWLSLLGAGVAAGAGFALFKLVAFLGGLFFGRKGKKFTNCVGWSLRENDDGSDILLRVEAEELRWSELFFEQSDKLTLREVELEGYGRQTRIQLSPTELVLSDGRRIPLEQLVSLQGTCKSWQLRRAAMGSGDAWIAMSIAALLGWQAVVFSLVAGSFIGLFWAVITRVGCAKPMPFGPCLLLAALLWLFGAGEWLNLLYA